MGKHVHTPGVTQPQCILCHTPGMKGVQTASHYRVRLLYTGDRRRLTLRDRKRNDDIRRILGVACITDKVREARLRWYGHVQRREEGDCVKRILEANVGGQRSRGRQRKRWIDVVKYNMEDLQLNVEDAENRAEWRRRTRVADPTPEGSTA